ncbi:hypothetical protein ACFQH6_20560 [Halobacteriaceae archaeon GCM10025711]
MVVERGEVFLVETDVDAFVLLTREVAETAAVLDGGDAACELALVDPVGVFVEFGERPDDLAAPCGAEHVEDVVFVETWIRRCRPWPDASEHRPNPVGEPLDDGR